MWGCSWRVVMSRIRLANTILKFIYENTNLPMCTSPRRWPGGGPAERSEQHCAGRRSTLDYNTGSIERPQGAEKGCPLPLGLEPRPPSLILPTWRAAAFLNHGRYGLGEDGSLSKPASVDISACRDRGLHSMSARCTYDGGHFSHRYCSPPRASASPVCRKSA